MNVMFPTSTFHPTATGFPFTGQPQQASIYQSNYAGFHTQMPAHFLSIPPARGQSLPATARQHPPIQQPYVSSHPHNIYPPVAASQQHDRQSKSICNKYM
jgi:hypothetical protein